MNPLDRVNGPMLNLHVVKPPTARPGQGHATVTSRWLAGLLAFNGIGALAGGIGLLTDSMGLPRSLLDGTPFDSYVIPGWILLVAVGGSSVTASIAVVRAHRRAAKAAIGAGVILLGWIVGEFVMIPEAWLLQLLYFVIALAIISLGVRLDRLNGRR